MEDDVLQLTNNDIGINPPGWFDWSFTGVNFDLAGNGGNECQAFLSVKQRIIECVLTTLVAGLVVYIAFSKITLPNVSAKTYGDFCGRRILLVIMCLTFGIELGFKLATRQMIYILNPCHVATMIQIYCLAAPPSKMVTAIFRFHLYMLSGAPIAILFPVVNTRLLPLETEIYYIQHILMLIIPIYLLTKGGVYSPEPQWKFDWAAFSIGVVFIYHFIFLQLLAYFSKVNLNNMLCPAISDPFYGPYYRLWALIHQTLVLLLLPKFLISTCLRISPSTVYNYTNETKVIDLLRRSPNVIQSEGHMDHTDVLSSSKNEEDMLNVKDFGNKVKDQNGVYSRHNRQPSNGHLTQS